MRFVRDEANVYKSDTFGTLRIVMSGNGPYPEELYFDLDEKAVCLSYHLPKISAVMLLVSLLVWIFSNSIFINGACLIITIGSVLTVILGLYEVYALSKKICTSVEVKNDVCTFFLD